MSLENILLSVPGILLGITVHEFAHGWVADRFGDPTPALAGRLTLNPLKHLDPIGALMLFIFRFGWAKPVPINPYNFREPKKAMIWVSLAGSLSNFVTAAFFGLVVRMLFLFPSAYTRPLFLMLIFVVLYNIILGIFNLIPIPPLDGSKILFTLAGEESEWAYFLQRYGMMILIGVIALGGVTGINLIWIIIGPLFRLLSIIFLGYDISPFI